MSTLLLLLLAAFLFNSFHTTKCAKAPAMFIFGDSLIDNGNNNFIPSIAKANYVPYGIDFGAPTGRFCNGLTVVDYGAKYLGLPFPVAYLSLASRTDQILKGVNYASAAAGILDETGKHYAARITFNGQITLFERTVTVELPQLIKNEYLLSQYLANSVFVINIGSNDYINNYLLPNLYTSSRIYSARAFADLLISNLSQQLTRLYQIGARKMVLVGIGPLGCIPSQLSLGNSTDGSCIEHVNNVVSLFNQRLVPQMNILNATLQGSFFVYENIYDTFLDIIKNPLKYGIRVVNEACCGNGKYGGAWSCIPFQSPCIDRQEYVFWDSFHPTQAANAIIADKCYSPSGTDCFPISVSRLAEL